MTPDRCGPPWWGPRRGRPPWWPEDEAWPPAAGSRAAWHRVRRRFLWRALTVLVAVPALVVAVSALVTWTAVRLFGAGTARGWPLAAAIVALTMVVMAGRAFHRLSAPVGDLIVALGRIADGEYRTRVREHGAREVRTLARAFNTMAERLERQEAKRHALLTDISHELRTPLAVLQGNLEGMLDGVYPRDADHLSLVLEETRILARLIEDLRTLTLSDSLELALARAPTDLGAIARDAIASFETRAAEVGVALRVDAQPGLPSAEVDPERVRQVLNNLLSNALRYTPAGGTIVVRCATGASERVVVTVEDTGAGIPAADLRHVFDRFHKSPDSRGTGLGLAIAKSLVEAHGGEITAESAPGRGTTVRVTLPLRPEP